MLLALYDQANAQKLKNPLRLYAESKDSILKLKKECYQLHSTLSKIEEHKVSDEVRPALMLTVAYSRRKLLTSQKELLKLTVPLRNTLSVVSGELTALYNTLIDCSKNADAEAEAREKCFLLRLLYRSLTQLVF